MRFGGEILTINKKEQRQKPTGKAYPIVLCLREVIACDVGETSSDKFPPFLYVFKRPVFEKVVIDFRRHLRLPGMNPRMEPGFRNTAMRSVIL